ncbi:MAG: MFS transporter [bacterium]
MPKKRHLLIIFLTVFIDFVGFGILIPIQPYYARTFGATAQQVTLLSVAFSIMQFIFAPFWGRLSDRWGRRPILLLSILGTGASYIFYGLAHNLWLLYIARILAGLFAANISVAQAYVADVTSEQARSRGMGAIGAGIGLGFLFGPVIGAITSHGANYALPSFMAAAVALGNFTFAYFELPESLSRPERSDYAHRRFDIEALKRAFSQPAIARLLIMYFLLYVGFSNMETTFGLLMDDRYRLSSSQTGYLLGYMGIVVVLVQGGLVRWVTKYLSDRAMMIVGCIVLVFALAYLPLAPSVKLLLIPLGMCSLGNGLSHPAMLSLISRCCKPEEKGGILGLNTSMGSLGRILGPLWAGWIYEQHITGPYWTGSALVVVVILIAFSLKPLVK